MLPFITPGKEYLRVVKFVGPEAEIYAVFTQGGEKASKLDILQWKNCFKIENANWARAKVHKDTVFENRRKKVSFDIASGASYVYILSGQKLIKK